MVRGGVAGGPRHEPVDQFTIDFFYFYKFALIFQHISRLLLNIVRNIEEIILTSATGGICARGEGVWRRRLVIYPDNCTYLSVIDRISVRGEGRGGGSYKHAGTSVVRELLSSQNGGPWDKTS